MKKFQKRFVVLQRTVSGLTIFSLVLAQVILAGLFIFPGTALAARTITDVTLDGASSVTVPTGASITAAVTVDSGGSGNDDWKSTQYTIEGQSAVCVDTPDHFSGSHTESFDITAPSSSGIYDVTFVAYRNGDCSSDSNTYTLTDGITTITPLSVTKNGGTFTSTYFHDANDSWSNPSNAVASDDSYATATIGSSSDVTYYLQATNFGFSIPAGATIYGIQVNVERHQTCLDSTPPCTSNVRDNRVRLVQSATIGSTNKADTSTNWSASDGTAAYGNSSDLWQGGWTVTNINDASTGVVLSAKLTNSNDDQSANVDYISMTVYYTPDTTPPTVTINQATGQGDPTADSSINFTVVFSESVSDFADGDVALSGTAEATTATVTGSSTTYNVAVSGMANDGTVIATIDAGRSHDAAGNPNTTSTSTDNTVNYILNTGWKSPSNNSADTGGDGDGFERNTTNAYSDGSGNAENRNGAGDRHKFYGYDFSSLSGVVIDGIEVRLDWWLSDNVGTNSMNAELSWDGGTSWTSAKSTTGEPESEQTLILGGGSDKWGRTSWSESDFSNSNFRVRITSNSTSSDRDFYLDWIPVRIYYTPDTTAPTVGISGVPADWTNADQTATVTCNDGSGSGCDAATYKIKTDSLNPGTCSTTYSDYTLSSPQTISSHLWVCGTAKDNAGNAGFSSPIEFKVDKTTPTIDEVQPGDGSYVRSTINLVASNVNDLVSGIANVNFYIDDDLVGAGGYSNPSEYTYSDWNSGSVSDGVHTLAVIATDAAGNSTTHSHSITVDNTAPTASVTAPADDSYIGGTITIRADASDVYGVARVVFHRSSIDPTIIGTDTTAPYEMDWNTTTVTDGEHAVWVEAYDNAGNAITSSSVDVIVDNAKPVTSALFNNEALSAFWYTISPVVSSLLATDDGGSGVASVHYILDSGSDTAYLEPFNISGDAIHSLSYWSVDNVGNVEDTHTDTIKIDTTKPNSNSTPPSYDNSGSIQIPYSASDVTSGLDTIKLQVSSDEGATWLDVEGQSFSYDGATSTPEDVFFTFTPDGQGRYDFRTIAKDVAGNEETKEGADGWTEYDVTAPASTATTNPSANAQRWIRGDLAQVDISATDSPSSGVKSISYKIDEAAEPVIVESSSTSFIVSGEGRHAVEYWSIDNAGNEEMTGNEETPHNILNVWLDNSVPSNLTLVSPEDGYITNIKPILSWLAEDILSGVKDYLLGLFSSNSTESSIGSPVTTTETSYSTADTISNDGLYYWGIKATDNADNQSEWSSLRSFTYDTTPPGLMSATVVSATRVEVTFSEDLQEDQLTIGDFSVTADDSQYPISSLTEDNGVVTLNLTNPLPNDATVTVMINPFIPGSIKDLAGNEQTAQRSVVADDHVPPEIVSIEAISATVIEVTFNEELQNNETHSPATSDFVVYNGNIDSPYQIASVSYENKKVTITLATPIQQGDEPYLWVGVEEQFRTTIIDLAGNLFRNKYDSTVYDKIAPVANISPSAVVGNVDESITFSGAGSTEFFTTIHNYAWDFGDGSEIQETETPTIFHSFAEAGVYDVVLTVFDNHENNGSITAKAIINSAQTKPAYQAEEGLEVQFNSLPDGSYNLNVVKQTEPVGGTSGFSVAGVYYEITSSLTDGQFSVDLTFEYPDADNDGIVDGTSINENNLNVYYWDGSSWSMVPNPIIDTVNNTITVTVDHFTQFGLMQQSQSSGTTGGGGGGGLLLGLTIAPESIRVSSIKGTSVTITWTTSDFSTSQVIYDTVPGKFNLDAGAPNYGYAYSKEGDDSGLEKVTAHSVTITGLQSDTTYYYRTVSMGSFVVGQESSFTTLAMTAEEQAGEVVFSSEIGPSAEEQLLQEGEVVPTEEGAQQPSGQTTITEQTAEKEATAQASNVGFLAAIGLMPLAAKVILIVIAVIIAGLGALMLFRKKTPKKLM